MERLRLIASVVLASLVLQATALGQGEAFQTTNLDLGFDTEQPGNEVVVPLILDLSQGVEVVQVTSQVTFPAQLLFFEGVTAGLSAQAAGAMVSAVKTTDENNPESETLTVTVSTKRGGSIPSGIIADLAFTIAEDAPIELTIKLGNVVSALTSDDPPRPVQPITGKEGEVLVSATSPIFACFFYMH